MNHLRTHFSIRKFPESHTGHKRILCARRGKIQVGVIRDTATEAECKWLLEEIRESVARPVESSFPAGHPYFPTGSDVLDEAKGILAIFNELTEEVVL